jgi:hypothetical protein
MDDVLYTNSMKFIATKQNETKRTEESTARPILLMMMDPTALAAAS